MHAHLLRFALGALLAPSLACGADKLSVTVSHDLDLARPSETIAIPWSEVNRALPGALIQRIVVKDAGGRTLPHQVTNVAPLSKDPKGVGVAYGELLFQYSFGAGEKTAAFSVEKIDALAPPFPIKAFARYVPERLDDFAWENDKIGHRTYGPALAAPAQSGSDKEVLVTSGLDIWFKRVEYPIVDRWYNVGQSRGCGGTGIWDGATLFTSHNFKSWKVIANGPIRAVFELSYDGWDGGGTRVSEVKRFTVDAGHQLDQIDSTFTFDGPAQLTVAIGLNKAPVDKKQEPKLSVTRNRDNPSLVQWVEQASNGAMGTAIVLPAAGGFAEDPLNHLILAPVTSGKPLRYYAGAAWARAAQINSSVAWEAYVAAAAARMRHPVQVRLVSQ